MKASGYIIVGGAGFIGGHLVDRLLNRPGIGKVTVYDNFSSGREWHIRDHLDDPRMNVVRDDAKNLEPLCRAMGGHDTVIHLASNPDIARAATEPEIDFYEGTLLTHNVVEAMRRTGCGRIIYASGSGIYGDLGKKEISEDHGPLVPVSTYGASKLAGEAMISAYCHMFEMKGFVFRFANVVGSRQTHGVGFDFIRNLVAENGRLKIMGDGSQSKSYIHVDDVIAAIEVAETTSDGLFNVFNVSTRDHVSVREIADMAVECVGLEAGSVEYEFTGGPRGWKGDVPVVRLNSDRIRNLGWNCKYSSRQALALSMDAILGEVKR